MGAADGRSAEHATRMIEETIAMTATASDLEKFVYREAQLLDEQRYEEWLELLADDVLYWVPNFVDNAAPGDFGVIVREDKLGLKARVARFRHSQNPTQKPAARTVHYLTNVVATSDGDGLAEVKANLLLYVSKNQRLMQHPGRIEYRLLQQGGDWRISRKKIYLITNDVALTPLPLI
jgi:3-phenylpropionate/cinnamic acid dioxygenase small subunit